MKCQNKKCSKEHDGSFGSGKYCSLSCSNTRNWSAKQRKQLSNRLCNWNKNNPRKKKQFLYICEKCKNEFDNYRKIRIETGKRIRCKNCRKKTSIKNISEISSILELSSRTVRKIIKRLNLGCSNCGWNESYGDVHHINGRKVEDPDNHKNLCYLCPNCHRLVGNKKISKEKLISLDSFIGDKWKSYYNIT